ncbi:MAG: tetratricopeptide repeat protein [Ignavibacteriae bacterium]|nr:tetratricopeptide repeat protein [Ignavibacteriota bacterium]
MTYRELQAQIDRANNEFSKGNLIEAEELASQVVDELDKPSHSLDVSAEDEWSVSKIATLRANALLARAKSIIYIGNYDSAIVDIQAALSLAEDHSLQAIKPLCWNLLGNVYINLSDFSRALEYYTMALSAQEELGQKAGTAIVTNNIGNVYRNLSDYPRALEYYTMALSAYEELGQKAGVALATGNIGIVYAQVSDYSRALEYMNKALSVYEELGDIVGAAREMGNMGIVYTNLSDYPQALEYLLKTLSSHEKLGQKADAALVTCNIGTVYANLADYERALEYFYMALHAHEELRQKAEAAVAMANIGTTYARKDFSGYDPVKAEEYLLRGIAESEETLNRTEIVSFHKTLADLYEEQEHWKEHSLHFKKYIEIERELNLEETKKTAAKQDTDKKLAIERTRSQATDDILGNILPPTIIERLIKGEKKIADTHENVSVLFVDIVGFTGISRQLPASELIDLLDIVFTRFDSICKKHCLEKIKTIGDAYMAVCGAPLASENHAERTARAALEMLEDFSIEREFSIPINLGFRIGLHSGSVVAGIIGENKYSYDMWGDAVNTASRMESYGEEDKIHVSEDFRNSAGNKFTFTDCGEMDFKGKGMMKTYFLEQKQRI